MRTFPFSVLLLAALSVLAGCARKPPEPVKTPPPTVIVEHPVVRQVNDYEDFAGRTEPFKMVELKSRVTGYLKKIHFKDGEDIKASTTLFEIDDRPFKAELARASATRTKAQKHLKTATADYTRIKAQYDQGVSEQALMDKATGDKAEAEADVEAAAAEVELATTNLEFCHIKAPFDGRLSKRMVDEENLVKADDTMLTTIVRLDKLYATFDIDERTVIRVRRLIHSGSVTSSREQPLVVKLALADDDDFPLSGTIVFTDNQIDPGTGTLRARAEVTNPKLARAPWFLLSPGQFVRVRVPIGPARNAVLVPERAVGSDQGQRFVFVVNDKKVVERRNVRVGQLYGSLRVVEDSLLAPTDRVIVDGLLRVRPGIEVNAKTVGSGK